MRTSTNQFNVNDAANALPTWAEYFAAEMARLEPEVTVTILKY